MQAQSPARALASTLRPPPWPRAGAGAWARRDCSSGSPPARWTRRPPRRRSRKTGAGYSFRKDKLSIFIYVIQVHASEAIYHAVPTKSFKKIAGRAPKGSISQAV